MKIGSWRDVWCTKNLCYYEAQVREVSLRKPKVKRSKKETGEAAEVAVVEKTLMVLFHFKGWSAKFDEWVEAHRC